MNYMYIWPTQPCQSHRLTGDPIFRGERVTVRVSVDEVQTDLTGRRLDVMDGATVVRRRAVDAFWRPRRVRRLNDAHRIAIEPVAVVFVGGGARQAHVFETQVDHARRTGQDVQRALFVKAILYTLSYYEITDVEQSEPFGKCRRRVSFGDLNFSVFYLVRLI